MKYPILSLIFSFLANWSAAQQNLVPNPGFEQYDTCPSNVSEIHQAIGWSSYLDSPDYFNTCASFNVDVPNNWVGHQQPASGNGYAGIYTCGNGDNYREYLGAQLINQLITGQKYYVSFKVNRCDNTLFSYSSNKQGVSFSTLEYSQGSPAPINNFAHIYNNSVITDSINWTRIFGSFVSDSAYQYIILGNFFDDANTNTIGNGNQYAYYYIDDVCVSTDSLYALDYIWTGIEQTPPSLINIYPNPATNSFTFESTGLLGSEIDVWNPVGQVVYSFKVYSPVMTINCSTWIPGIYFVKNETFITKMIIGH